MSTMPCDNVRDRLPDLVNGRLSGSEAAALRTHAAGCAACAAELRLVQALHAQEIAPPFGLERRVLRAVRAGPPKRAWSPVRLAMAATVVFALVTAGLLTRDAGQPQPGNDGEISLEVQEVTAADLPGPADPLLSGAPALHNLSNEQLERLLRELGS
jgi:hypothetical protein